MRAGYVTNQRQALDLVRLPMNIMYRGLGFGLRSRRKSQITCTDVMEYDGPPKEEEKLEDINNWHGPC